jgi:hypothetical protein
MALYSPCAHECADRPNLPCPACDWSDTIKFQLGQIVATPDVLVFRLSWKWRKRSSVKIAERTYEKRAQALHC